VRIFPCSLVFKVIYILRSHALYAISSRKSEVNQGLSSSLIAICLVGIQILAKLKQLIFKIFLYVFVVYLT